MTEHAPHDPVGRPGRPVARALPLATLLSGSLLAGGCALQPPAAWEKGHLARPDMALAADPLQSRLQQKVYASRENAAGGAAIGGGGCGCN